MAKNPAQRPPTAAAFGDELRAALTAAGSATTGRPTEPVPRLTAGPPPAAPPLPPPSAAPSSAAPSAVPRGRRGGFIAAAAVLIVLVAVVAVVAFVRLGDSGEDGQTTSSEADPGDEGGAGPNADEPGALVAPMIFRPPGDARYAVAATDGVYISDDGETFTRTFDTGLMNQVAAGMTGWVAVGAEGAFFSADGNAWKQVAEGPNLRAVATDGRRWVVGGTSGRLGVSDDGETFRTSRFPTDETISAIATDGTTWVAVGSGGYLATSTDGEQWRATTTGIVNDLEAVAHADGQWVVVGRDGVVVTSTDAVTWNAMSIGDDDSLSSVVRADGAWLAGGVTLRRSEDGETWTQVPEDLDGYVQWMQWDGERLVALTQRSRLYLSESGALWAISSEAAGPTPPPGATGFATTIPADTGTPVTLHANGLGVALAESP